jgi:hypothetical protein
MRLFFYRFAIDLLLKKYESNCYPLNPDKAMIWETKNSKGYKKRQQGKKQSFLMDTCDKMRKLVSFEGYLAPIVLTVLAGKR